MRQRTARRKRQRAEQSVLKGDEPPGPAIPLAAAAITAAGGIYAANKNAKAQKAAAQMASQGGGYGQPSQLTPSPTVRNISGGYSGRNSLLGG
jgi:hypothetical protein